MIIKFMIASDKEACWFLSVENGKLLWTIEPDKANAFPSRYAAKRYMKLVHPSETGWIVVQQ